MTSTTHKPDGAAVLAAALFDLSERAMRDAARLAVIASTLTRGKIDYAHFALSNYVARREGNAYGRDEAQRALETLRELSPAIAERAARHNRNKENEQRRTEDFRKTWAAFDTRVSAGQDERKAWAKTIGTKTGSNVVRVLFRGPDGGSR